MKITLFKIFTGIAGLYHLVLGLAGLVLPAHAFSKISSIILGMTPKIDAQLQLVIKFSATYVLVFGVMLTLLAINPVKNRILTIPALTLFGIRLINKIVFFSAIGAAFEIPFARNLFAVASLFFFFTAILLTIPPKSST